MKVREAGAEDAAAIYAVHRASIRELGPTAYDDDQVAAWGRGGGPDGYDLTGADSQFVVAEKGDEIVGFGCLQFGSDEDLRAAVDAEITAVYVHPSAVRQGVGSALLSELERTAREHELGSLGLLSSRNAVPFYEHHGYERIGERTHEFSGGVEGTVVEMRTELQDGDGQ